MNAAASLPRTRTAHGARHPATQYRSRPPPAHAGRKGQRQGRSSSRALHLDPGLPPACLKPGPEPAEKRAHHPLTPARSFRDVKPSAKPTLVRTQHLPPPNPRSGRVPVYPEAGSDACPGAVRQTADGFGGPVVGQIWPGQRPAAERARSRASRARFRKGGPLGRVFPQVTGGFPALAWRTGSSGVPLRPAVTRTHDGRNPPAPGCFRGPAAGRASPRYLGGAPVFRDCGGYPGSSQPGRAAAGGCAVRAVRV